MNKMLHSIKSSGHSKHITFYDATVPDVFTSLD